MEITDVGVECDAWPKPKPISNGKYTYTKVAFNIVKVSTDEGVTGIGWGGGTAATPPAAVSSALVDHFKVTLIGEGPFTYRRIWENMWLPKIVGRRGMSTHKWRVPPGFRSLSEKTSIPATVFATSSSTNQQLFLTPMRRFWEASLSS